MRDRKATAERVSSMTRPELMVSSAHCSNIELLRQPHALTADLIEVLLPQSPNIVETPVKIAPTRSYRGTL